MNEDSQIRGENTKIATQTARYMVMDVAEASDAKNRITNDTVRAKIREKSLPSPQTSFYHRPMAPKVKSQAHSNSYLAQAGHIYYPPSSQLAQIHEVNRQPDDERSSFGGLSEPNLCTTYGNSALKIPTIFSAHNRYEVIGENRTSESFVRRIHKPASHGADRSLPVQTPILSASSQSICHTRNTGCKQLSTLSADVQSITRPVAALEQLMSGNDSGNIPSSAAANGSSEFTVWDKATNIREAVGYFIIPFEF